MKRRRAGHRDDGITLFPFLAVLICTMGSLIVLLVVVVQQAKASAAKASRQQADRREQRAREIKEVEESKEEFDWRIQVLESSRVQLMEQLDDRRLQLSHLENEIHQLKAQLDAAIEEAEQIARLENDNTAEQIESEQRVDQLRDALRRAEADLDDARQAMTDRRPSYSIVPYQGPHGTQRRPLFIECLADRVVIQPEGLELTERDFVQPLTDSNPLAAALRAKREYLSNAFRTSDGHPYPLLIVRPKGAKSYAAARAAMKSWDAEFGYELVGEDLQLNYPATDPAMLEMVRQAVELARERRRRLQAIAPARFGRVGSTMTLKASRNGGFVRDGGDDAGRPSSRSGTGFERDSGRGLPTAQRDRPDSWTSTGTGSDQTGKSGPNGPSPSDGDGSRQFPRRGDRTPASSFNSAANSGLSLNGAGGQGDHSSGASDSSTSDSAAHASRAADGSIRDHSSMDATGGSSSRGGQNGRPTSSSATASSAMASAGASGSSGATNFQATGASAGMSNGMAPPTAAIADSRGHDWGLPNRGVGATGITRPIRLVVTPARLELLPEDRSTRGGAWLPVEGSMHDEIEELVGIIWRRMDGWGIAGANMYWKPVLSVRVEPAAETRYEELKALLRNSGIVVERKR